MSTTVKSASDFTCWREPQHTQISTTLFGWPQCATCRAAPPYHERPDYLVPGFALGLYVPTGPLAAIVAPRSGVVGLPDGADRDDPEARVSIYYEGWTNGAMQYEGRDAQGLWEAGVEHAASRMVTSYPTIACALPRASELTYFGLYWPKTKRMEIDFPEVLERWLA